MLQAMQQYDPSADKVTLMAATWRAYAGCISASRTMSRSGRVSRREALMACKAERLDMVAALCAAFCASVRFRSLHAFRPWYEWSSETQTVCLVHGRT